jgi:phosphatidylglycerol:prolipoprotein diacylglycerol transferase
MRDPLNWIKIWEGGLSIHGAVIGGALAIFLYCKRYGISFLRWTDIIAPGLILAQAIGRWGNYFNQEAFGAPTDLPWGIPIDTQMQTLVAGIQNPDPATRFHPTFAYEMIWNLIGFGLLMWLGRQRRLRLRFGDVFWVYLIFYSIGRFAIEELRVDSAMVGGLKTPQVFSVLLILLGWTMLIVSHRPRSNVPFSPENLPYEEQEAAYAEAGVGADAGEEVDARMRPVVERTWSVRRVPSSLLDREDRVVTSARGEPASESG